jgi:hypothetical protein
VEPVLANLRHNKQLNRFTLRSQAKVDNQWKMYALGRNIEKPVHHRYAQKASQGIEQTGACAHAYFSPSWTPFHAMAWAAVADG